MALPKLNTPTFKLTLPSTGKAIEFRPFLVKEEKVLMMSSESNDPADMVQGLKQIVENCTFGKVKPDEHPLFDLEYIFLNLRAKSVGEIAEPMFKPDGCDKMVQLKVDLSEVEVVTAEGHTKKIELTDTVGLIMKYPSIAQAENQTTLENLEDPDVAMGVISDCIDKIYDGDSVYKAEEHGQDELKDFIESLTQSQFLKITNFFESMPKIRYTTKYTCPCSGEEKEITLSGLQDFFGLPSATTT